MEIDLVGFRCEKFYKSDLGIISGLSIEFLNSFSLSVNDLIRGCTISIIGGVFTYGCSSLEVSMEIKCVYGFNGKRCF